MHWIEWATFLVTGLIFAGIVWLVMPKKLWKRNPILWLPLVTGLLYFAMSWPALLDLVGREDKWTIIPLMPLSAPMLLSILIWGRKAQISGTTIATVGISFWLTIAFLVAFAANYSRRKQRRKNSVIASGSPTPPAP